MAVPSMAAMSTGLAANQGNKLLSMEAQHLAQISETLKSSVMSEILGSNKTLGTSENFNNTRTTAPLQTPVNPHPQVIVLPPVMPVESESYKDDEEEAELVTESEQMEQTENDEVEMPIEDRKMPPQIQEQPQTSGEKSRGQLFVGKLKNQFGFGKQQEWRRQSSDSTIVLDNQQEIRGKIRRVKRQTESSDTSSSSSNSSGRGQQQPVSGNEMQPAINQLVRVLVNTIDAVSTRNQLGRPQASSSISSIYNDNNAQSLVNTLTPVAQQVSSLVIRRIIDDMPVRMANMGQLAEKLINTLTVNNPVILNSPLLHRTRLAGDGNSNTNNNNNDQSQVRPMPSTINLSSPQAINPNLNPMVDSVSTALRSVIMDLNNSIIRQSTERMRLAIMNAILRNKTTQGATTTSKPRDITEDEKFLRNLNELTMTSLNQKESSQNTTSLGREKQTKRRSKRSIGSMLIYGPFSKFYLAMMLNKMIKYQSSVLGQAVMGELVRRYVIPSFNGALGGANLLNQMKQMVTGGQQATGLDKNGLVNLLTIASGTKSQSFNLPNSSLSNSSDIQRLEQMLASLTSTASQQQPVPSNAPAQNIGSDLDCFQLLGNLVGGSDKSSLMPAINSDDMTQMWQTILTGGTGLTGGQQVASLLANMIENPPISVNQNGVTLSLPSSQSTVTIPNLNSVLRGHHNNLMRPLGSISEGTNILRGRLETILQNNSNQDDDENEVEDRQQQNHVDHRNDSFVETRNHHYHNSKPLKHFKYDSNHHNSNNNKRIPPKSPYDIPHANGNELFRNDKTYLKLQDLMNDYLRHASPIQLLELLGQQNSSDSNSVQTRGQQQELKKSQLQVDELAESIMNKTMTMMLKKNLNGEKGELVRETANLIGDSFAQLIKNDMNSMDQATNSSQVKPTASFQAGSRSNLFIDDNRKILPSQKMSGSNVNNTVLPRGAHQIQNFQPANKYHRGYIVPNARPSHRESAHQDQNFTQSSLPSIEEVANEQLPATINPNPSDANLELTTIIYVEDETMQETGTHSINPTPIPTKPPPLPKGFEQAKFKQPFRQLQPEIRLPLQKQLPGVVQTLEEKSRAESKENQEVASSQISGQQKQQQQSNNQTGLNNIAMALNVMNMVLLNQKLAKNKTDERRSREHRDRLKLKVQPRRQKLPIIQPILITHGNWQQPQPLKLTSNSSQVSTNTTASTTTSTPPLTIKTEEPSNLSNHRTQTNHIRQNVSLLVATESNELTNSMNSNGHFNKTNKKQSYTFQPLEVGQQSVSTPGVVYASESGNKGDQSSNLSSQVATERPIDANVNSNEEHANRWNDVLKHITLAN